MINLILAGIIGFITGSVLMSLGIMNGLHKMNNKFVEETGIDFIDFLHHKLDKVPVKKTVVEVEINNED